MKLLSDSRCRIQSRELLKANTPYDAELAADGRIILRELPPMTVPRARLTRRNGRTYLETNHVLTNEDVDSALAEFP